MNYDGQFFNFVSNFDAVLHILFGIFLTVMQKLNIMNINSRETCRLLFNRRCVFGVVSVVA